MFVYSFLGDDLLSMVLQDPLYLAQLSKMQILTDAVTDLALFHDSLILHLGQCNHVLATTYNRDKCKYV